MSWSNLRRGLGQFFCLSFDVTFSRLFSRRVYRFFLSFFALNIYSLFNIPSCKKRGDEKITKVVLGSCCSRKQFTTIVWCCIEAFPCHARWMLEVTWNFAAFSTSIWKENLLSLWQIEDSQHRYSVGVWTLSM